MKLLVLILDTKYFRFSKVEKLFFALILLLVTHELMTFCSGTYYQGKKSIYEFFCCCWWIVSFSILLQRAFILEIWWTSKYLLLSWASFCTYLAMFWYFFPIWTFQNTFESCLNLPPRYLSPSPFLPLKMLLSPWSPWFDWWVSHPENTSRVLNIYVGND